MEADHVYHDGCAILVLDFQEERMRRDRERGMCKLKVYMYIWVSIWVRRWTMFRLKMQKTLHES
jgi:hypothetical protein